MSQQLISRSPALKRLRDEEYNVSIVDAHLVVSDVPYVTASGDVKLGKLVTDLKISGDAVSGMGSHVAFFVGEYPCDQNGKPLEHFRHSSGRQNRGPNLTVEHSFSAMPTGPSGKRAYKDYYEKMTAYIWAIASHAQEINPSISPQNSPVFETSEEESVFRYEDTASSRAGIGALADKMALRAVGIVGLGGTGGYILDHVAKTRVKNIHLFDGDVFSNHNAFRAPGAASLEELRAKPNKVKYYHALYSKLRRGVHAHVGLIDEESVEQLRAMSFVFLCVDNGPARKLIVEKLEEFGTPFIDVGMGVDSAEDGSLIGTLRVALSMPEMREHIHEGNRIPFEDGVEQNLYATNIQVSELNCMNACLAVIKWKKLIGFYFDEEREHFSTYSVHGNVTINDDCESCSSPNLRIAS